MKITYAITKGNWGGAQKYVFELACAAKEVGHDVSIIFGSPGKLAEYADEAGIRTIILPRMERDIHIFQEISNFFTLINILKKENPNIVHLNSPKMGGLGSVASRIAGIKTIVYTAHGWSFNEDRSELSKRIIKFFSWLIIVFSTKVIVLSEHERQQVVNWPNARRKLRVIPIGIKEIDFVSKQEARTVLRASSPSLPDSPDTIWIGNIAELHKNKGLEYAIRSLADLPSHINYLYVIMGIGEEQKKLTALIEKLHLEHKVFLVGFQKSGVTLLKAFDLFLFSSIKEGLPYALLEAGLASLPVISTDVGSISDLITDRSSGLLVPSKNPEALKNAIEELVFSTAARTEYGKNLNHKISTEFSFKKMVEKSLSYYSA